MRDNGLEIQLGSTKHINSVDEDTYTNIELSNSENSLLEYDINNILSVSDVFEQERQKNEIYRIYGGVEYFSLFNGMVKSYSELEHFFIQSGCTPGFDCNTKTIYDDFDFYLVRPSQTVEKLPGDSVSYVRYFEVIATPNEFELFEAGFSKNVFNQQKYAFSFNKDFDVSGVVDGFGMPLTELYLFTQYKPKAVPYGVETMMRSRWHNSFSSTSFINFQPQPLNKGDLIYGDKVEYYESDFNQVKISPLTYKIITPYVHIIEILKSDPQILESQLRWFYNPLTPLKLRFFSDNLSKANKNSTSYDQRNSIPEYATNLGDENYVWRNLLEQGYIDPITGEGVDYPFVNKKRYLFSNIVLTISPDLTHDNTNNAFEEIRFSNPTLLNTNVINNVDNIGRPC